MGKFKDVLDEICTEWRPSDTELEDMEKQEILWKIGQLRDDIQERLWRSKHYDEPVTGEDLKAFNEDLGEIIRRHGRTKH